MSIVLNNFFKIFFNIFLVSLSQSFTLILYYTGRVFVKCFYVGLYTGRQDVTTHYHTGRCVRMVLQRRQDTAYTGPFCVRQDVYRQDTTPRQDTSVLYVDRTSLVSVRSINVWTATSHTGPPHINSDRTYIYKKDVLSTSLI